MNISFICLNLQTGQEYLQSDIPLLRKLTFPIRSRFYSDIIYEEPFILHIPIRPTVYGKVAILIKINWDLKNFVIFHVKVFGEFSSAVVEPIIAGKISLQNI